jgi:myo-inositol-1(or 4)-monophosphatase
VTAIPDSRYRGELQVAERAAREAGSIIMGLFKGRFEVTEKGKNNPVTTADLNANRKIRELIQSAFPDDGWLSEEDKDNDHRLGVRRAWVVDPIDGTKEFIEGVPQFAISIGLVVDGQPRAAVVYNPAEKLLYKAVAGQGAYLNEQRIQVSGRSEVDGALLLVSRSEPQKKFKVFVEQCAIQPIGSIAFRLAKIAGGEGDGTLTFRSIHDWDICGGVLIVTEAGGAVVDGRGNPFVFNRHDTRHLGVIAANAILTRRLQHLWEKAMSEKS